MFISYGRYQFTIINVKLIMAPLEHEIEEIQGTILGFP